MSLVGDDSARRDVGTYPEERFELPAVICVVACEMEVALQAVGSHLK
jgi:hypothetical protein